MLLLVATASAQTAQQQITDEIARLRKVAETMPADEDWKQVQPMVEPGLAGAEAAAKDGKLFLALHRLAQARTLVMAIEHRLRNPKAAAADLAQFEADWSAQEKPLAEREARYKQADWSHSPAVVRAMAEAAWGQTRILYQAAKAYAAVTSPSSGYHYLGETNAAIDWALFLNSLKFAEKSEPRETHAITADIQELEKRVLAAYVPPRSVEKHREFIIINSNLKEAIELNERGLYAGATYAYLKSLRQFEDLDAATPEPSEAAALQKKHDEMAAKLKAAGAEQSLGAIYLQGAESALKKGAPEDLRSAKIALERMVPAYLETMEAKPMAAAATPAKAANKDLTITLVRWPYT